MIEDFGRNERDRLARVEADLENLQRWVAADSLELQSLRAAANMGRGAWAFIIRLGGVLVVLAGAFAWLWDRIGGKHP